MFVLIHPYTCTPMCVGIVYAFLSSVKKSQAYYLGGIRTQNLFKSKAVSYQLDHWDKSTEIARGRLNPIYLCSKYDKPCAYPKLYKKKITGILLA